MFHYTPAFMPDWSGVMALTSGTLAKKPRSFDPQEPEWHRMISEAAYFLAEKRGFVAIGILLYVVVLGASAIRALLLKSMSV
jgi:DUF2934 family protein